MLTGVERSSSSGNHRRSGTAASCHRRAQATARRLLGGGGRRVEQLGQVLSAGVDEWQRSAARPAEGAAPAGSCSGHGEKLVPCRTAAWLGRRSVPMEERQQRRLRTASELRLRSEAPARTRGRGWSRRHGDRRREREATLSPATGVDPAAEGWSGNGSGGPDGLRCRSGARWCVVLRSNGENGAGQGRR
jgi:hypothetical protein